MENQNKQQPERREPTQEQLEDVLAEKLAYLFIEQIKIKMMKEQNDQKSS